MILKKILWFSLSLSLSFIAFCIVVVLCLLLSGFFGQKTDAEPEAPRQKDGFILDVSVFFVDEPTDRLFATVLTLDTVNGTVTALPIDCRKTAESKKTLKEVYNTEGLYPFADAVERMSGRDVSGFIKLNSNTFVTITDRMKNIVYNDENDGVMLLTGVQAERLLDRENFCHFCQTVASGILDADIKKEFLIITGICETDLSYPLLYDLVRGN